MSSSAALSLVLSASCALRSSDSSSSIAFTCVPNPTPTRRVTIESIFQGERSRVTCRWRAAFSEVSLSPSSLAC
eukprot:2797760-Rhodomonas_salina.2